MDVAGFYSGRSVLVTGATGFLGKVLVEKLLRCCPDLKKVYVVVRRKGNQTAGERIKKIVQLELFNRIHQECPSVLTKLVPLEGDITFTDLGLSDQDISTVIQDVSVIMHAAATVKFNETLRLASKLNLEGTINTAKLAKRVLNLKAFVHVSTAYSNCDREFIDEGIYPASIKPMDFLELLEDKNDEELLEMTNLILNHHPNTYTLTKLLAENYLEEHCKDLPLIISRPAIVTATWREPFSGWSEEKQIVTGMIVQAGKGVLRTMLSLSKGAAEFIPVDICVNQIIVAAWDVVTNNKFSESTIPVLNGVSSPINVLTKRAFHDLSMKHIHLYPFRKPFNYPECTYTANRLLYEFQFYYYHYLPAAAFDFYLGATGKKPLAIRLYSKLYTALEEYSKFSLRENIFCCKNVLELQDRLNPEDKEEFNVSLKELDWDIYFQNYVRSVRRLILKEDDSTLPQTRKYLKRMYYKSVLAKVLFFIFICYVIFKIILMM